MKTPESYTRHLLVAGVTLFLLGLLNGAVIQQFDNPKMALSAHLAAVQNALVLFAFGLMWKHLRLSAAAERWCYWLSIYGLYAIWVSLVLAAAWGTSSATPIAGAGFSASPVRESIVNFVLYSGSIAIVASSVAILVGLVRGRNNQ